VNVTSHLLPEFVRLPLTLDPDEFAEGVRLFAQRWGPLGVCRHDRAQFHDIECSPRPVRAARGANHVSREWWEPMSVWRGYSTLALRLGFVARALYYGEVIPEWAAQLLYAGRDARMRLLSLSEQREAVADELQYWAYLGLPHLTVDWSEETPRPVWVYGGVLGAVAVELVKLAASTDVLEICSSCGKPFPPVARRAAGQARFCDACQRDKAPGRLRAMRMRRAKQSARVLAHEGKGVPEIARELRRPEARIEAWLREPPRPNPKERREAKRRKQRARQA
jgi:hypothetical protein